jgi:hypothetical protein
VCSLFGAVEQQGQIFTLVIGTTIAFTVSGSAAQMQKEMSQ